MTILNALKGVTGEFRQGTLALIAGYAVKFQDALIAGGRA
jgi:hypothetical protein